MPVSKAQQKAVVKYVKNKYDRHMLTMPKGRKAELQAHASERSESLNGFVNRAIDCQIERDNHAQEPTVITDEKPVANEKANAISVNDENQTGNKSETGRGRASQSKPTGKPSQELIEAWLKLSDSGIGSVSIERMPESGGFKQTTIRKYLRLAREAQADERGEDNAQA